MITPRAKRCVAPVARQVGDELPEPRRIDREQRQDRAELDQHLEGLAGALEAEQAPGEQQMRRRGDRNELGHALDDAEDDGVEDRLEDP